MNNIFKNLFILLIFNYLYGDSIIYRLLVLDYGYFIYTINFIFITQYSRFLQGSSFNNNLLISNNLYILSKILFLLILIKGLIYLFPYLIKNNSCLILINIYFCIYLDRGEYNGNYRLDDNSYIRNIFYNLLKSNNHEIFMVNNEYKNDLFKEKYILALHPHGFIPFATGVNLSLSPQSKNIYNNYYKSLYNNLYPGTATFNYFFPILRELYLLFGTIDCSRPNLTNYLNNNKSIALFIGGARESIYCGKGKTTLILNRRNGFLKLALETGTSIIPVFTFGENDKFTSFTCKNNIIFELFHRLTGLWMPIIKYNLFESNIISVIGKPIHVEKNINYNENDIFILKEKYKNNLNTLFEKFKHKHENYIDRSLIII